MVRARTDLVQVVAADIGVDRVDVALVGLGGHVVARRHATLGLRQARPTRGRVRGACPRRRAAGRLRALHRPCSPSGSRCPVSSGATTAASGSHPTCAGWTSRSVSCSPPSSARCGCGSATTRTSAPWPSTGAGSRADVTTSSSSPARSASVRASSSAAARCSVPAAMPARWGTSWSVRRVGTAAAAPGAAGRPRSARRRSPGRWGRAAPPPPTSSPPSGRSPRRTATSSTRSGTTWASASRASSTCSTHGSSSSAACCASCCRPPRTWPASALNAAALAAPAEQVELVVPSLEGDAVLIGAAEMAWEDLLVDPVALLRGDVGRRPA